MNIYTGTLTNVKDYPSAEEEKVLKTHPKDNADMIDAELSYYCQNYGRLRKYCGETGSVVNGDQNERWVYECIAAIIFRAPPPAPPRKGLTDNESSNSSSSSFVCDCVSIPSKVMDCYMTTV
ncbi:hypothetical protein NQ314_006929 [Rhamnusium bicolor]|uniref:Uncharacterized protein n=1 Tax=Rhamnusium bicolor TaxID=1586634 RepID=A0AAV8YVA3_9CUCU|nr:hypothetical protein NQ314_006929 [Rhamnusium bicolor]